jgi:SAM-dependent methyltransferase
VHIEWSEHIEMLLANARRFDAWYRTVARDLVRPGDRLALDVGCGGAGMTLAMAQAMTEGRVLAVDGDEAVLRAARERVRTEWTDARVTIDVMQADLDHGIDAEPADLVWASASVHHAGDQQATVTSLARLLRPGGRLALAEGGLPSRHLPWDVGVGEPGLEIRLEAAQDRWFAAMRAGLPGSVPMPYGWTEALRRAGLAEPATRTTLIEAPTPLSETDRAHAVASLATRVGWLREANMLHAGDDDAWTVLLDPEHESWIGRRDDLTDLSARSVHVAVAPA